MFVEAPQESNTRQRPNLTTIPTARGERCLPYLRTLSTSLPPNCLQYPALASLPSLPPPEQYMELSGYKVQQPILSVDRHPHGVHRATPFLHRRVDCFVRV